MKPVFAKGVWFPGAGSVDDPAEVVRAYARLFVAQGGGLLQSEVAGLRRLAGEGWEVQGSDGALCAADQVVLALGHTPRDDLSEAIRAMGIPLQMAGDCLAPRTAEEAVFEGLKAGWGV